MSSQKKPQNKKIGKNILEIDKLSDFFEKNLKENKENKPPLRDERMKLSQRKEFTLFNYTQYYEQEVVKKRVRELIEIIRQEIESIKQSNKTLLAEVKDIERLTAETVSEKAGIYHVRFLEVIISILRNLRKKIGESKTWLEALMTKKKKRGSLFAVRSKKMGTLYSLSQELQTSRSVQ